MRNLEIEKYGASELSLTELKNTDGGFLPVLVIYAAWGVMAACSAVAIGMAHAAKDKGIIK